MIYVGTAGFSYQDWKGEFYPEKFDARSMLEFYSARFPVVEINSTWHALPSPQRMLSMAERTPDRFKFIVKAYKGITHQYEDNEGDFKGFNGAIRPLVDYGKLAGVLAQFPWGFKNTPGNRDYLRLSRERMSEIPLFVEFRNENWITDSTIELLRELEMGFCCVDEPRLRGLVKPHVYLTARNGYVRFHGRNYETWWDKNRESWERYNYIYSNEELGEWVPDIERLGRESENTYVIFNNHYRGQAVRNARMMARLLPPELVVPVSSDDGKNTLF
jgi:uncharacterized protein YecE (DUF72 family)